MNSEQYPASGAHEDEFPPPAILSEVGDFLEGEVTGFSEGPSRYRPEPITIVYVQRDDGLTFSLWANSTVLERKLGRLAPRLGERLRVEFLGKRQGASAEYKDFRVEVLDRAPFQPDWAKLAGDVHEEPEP